MEYPALISFVLVVFLIFLFLVPHGRLI